MMPPLKPNSLHLLLTTLVCFMLTMSFCQTSSVSGLVLDLSTKKPVAGAKVDLQFKNGDNYKVVETAITDTTGSFIFKNINPQHYSLNCFYKMKASKINLPKEFPDNLGRSETDSNFNVSAGSSYTHTFYLMITCPYDITRDQDYCPFCKKRDMVQPIFWGSPIFDKNGSYIAKGEDLSKYHLGGCSPDIWCRPAKHCNRCSIDF
jgi:hypothetical protein